MRQPDHRLGVETAVLEEAGFEVLAAGVTRRGINRFEVRCAGCLAVLHLFELGVAHVGGDRGQDVLDGPFGDVRLNGVPLSCPSEWRIKPGVDDVIELMGDACTTFKAEPSTFSATFPCGAIVVE